MGLSLLSSCPCRWSLALSTGQGEADERLFRHSLVASLGRNECLNHPPRAQRSPYCGHTPNSVLRTSQGNA
jgi:hypothetical protein